MCTPVSRLIMLVKQSCVRACVCVCVCVSSGYVDDCLLHNSNPSSFFHSYSHGVIEYISTAGVWSCPATTGERPPPCSNFTFTAVDDRRAVMFGGRNGEKGQMDDVYIIDLSTMVKCVCVCISAWACSCLCVCVPVCQCVL